MPTLSLFLLILHQFLTIDSFSFGDTLHNYYLDASKLNNANPPPQSSHHSSNNHNHQQHQSYSSNSIPNQSNRYKYTKQTNNCHYNSPLNQPALIRDDSKWHENIQLVNSSTISQHTGNETSRIGTNPTLHHISELTHFSIYNNINSINYNDYHANTQTLQNFPNFPHLNGFISPTSVNSAQLLAINVLDFGAIGDASTDNSVAFQTALNYAASIGGAVVYAPSGLYWFDSQISIPTSVTLLGSYISIGSHQTNGATTSKKPTDGTVFYVNYGLGMNYTNASLAFLTVNSDATLKGVVIFYPGLMCADSAETQQIPDRYAAAICVYGNNANVLDVECLNCYVGMLIYHSQRHYVSRFVCLFIYSFVWLLIVLFSIFFAIYYVIEFLRHLIYRISFFSTSFDLERNFPFAIYAIHFFLLYKYY